MDTNCLPPEIVRIKEILGACDPKVVANILCHPGVTGVPPYARRLADALAVELQLDRVLLGEMITEHLVGSDDVVEPSIH